VYSEDSSGLSGKKAENVPSDEPRLTIDLAWAGVNGSKGEERTLGRYHVINRRDKREKIERTFSW
jgi:hypothetical protein